jgi:hypothetical protein
MAGFSFGWAWRRLVWIFQVSDSQAQAMEREAITGVNKVFSSKPSKVGFKPGENPRIKFSSLK